MEQDLLDLQESIDCDKQRTTKLKHDKLLEGDELRREVRGLRTQVEALNEVIEKLENDKEAQRRELRVLRGARPLEEGKYRMTSSHYSVGGEAPLSLSELRSSLHKF